MFEKQNYHKTLLNITVSILLSLQSFLLYNIYDSITNLQKDVTGLKIEMALVKR